ncbi:MAG: hypothetical protein V1911_01885 [Candidatus Micrarchaeota archaeon]
MRRASRIRKDPGFLVRGKDMVFLDSIVKRIEKKSALECKGASIKDLMKGKGVQNIWLRDGVYTTKSGTTIRVHGPGSFSRKVVTLIPGKKGLTITEDGKDRRHYEPVTVKIMNNPGSYDFPEQFGTVLHEKAIDAGAPYPKILKYYKQADGSIVMIMDYKGLNMHGILSEARTKELEKIQRVITKTTQNFRKRKVHQIGVNQATKTELVYDPRTHRIYIIDPYH